MQEQLTEFIKGQIIFLFNKGETQLSISKKLNIPKTTLGDVIRKYKKFGITERLPGSGRPRSLTLNVTKALCNISNKNPRKKATQLKKEIETKYKVSVSARTIGRNLNENGLIGRVARKKPLLSSANMVSRLNLSKKFLGFSDMHWKSIIFSDESAFEVFNSNNRQYVYRKNGTAFENKNLTPTVKFGGGKIMVWGCINFFGTGNLVIIDGTLNSVKYINLLANNLQSSVEKIGLSRFVFQQDGASCHTSKLTMSFFEENSIKLLDWASQSPDLNPIEHVWQHMKVQLLKNPPKSKTDLKEKLLQIWEEIPLEFIQKLIMGMFKRSKAVYDSKGGHTTY